MLTFLVHSKRCRSKAQDSPREKLWFQSLMQDCTQDHVCDYNFPSNLRQLWYNPGPLEHSFYLFKGLPALPTTDQQTTTYHVTGGIKLIIPHTWETQVTTYQVSKFIHLYFIAMSLAVVLLYEPPIIFPHYAANRLRCFVSIHLRVEWFPLSPFIIQVSR